MKKEIIYSCMYNANLDGALAQPKKQYNKYKKNLLNEGGYRDGKL